MNLCVFLKIETFRGILLTLSLQEKRKTFRDQLIGMKRYYDEHPEDLKEKLKKIKRMRR